MSEAHINSLLLRSLNKTWKQNQILSSIIWNQVINFFKENKNIDITNYIISIKILSQVIIIKTQKPIINSQILENKQKILNKIHDSFEKIWIKNKNLDLKCI